MRAADLGRRAVLGLTLVTLFTSVHAERPQVFALTGGRIVVAPGHEIDGGTLVLRDGLIEAVGAEVGVPDDAVVIDATGLWLYPGLIDAGGSLGMKSGGGQRPTPTDTASFIAAMTRRPEKPAGAAHPIAMVHPEKAARDRLEPFGGDKVAELDKRRKLGFTVALATPSSGIFRGTSTAILLKEEAGVGEMLLRDPVAQHIGLSRVGFGRGYPSSLMGSAAAIRQAFHDAERYGRWQAAWEQDPQGLKRPERLDAWVALAPVLDGSQRVFFHLDDPRDLELAEALSDEFGLDTVFVGAGHEWEVADELAATGRALILPLIRSDKPKVDDETRALDVSLRTLRRYTAWPESAARLERAGVPFAFTTAGMKGLGDLSKKMTLLLERGLSAEAALAAWTTVPAELLGIDRLVGTLEAGKLANVVVTDGPLFDKETKVKRVYVDGVEHEIKHKEKPKGDPNAVVDPRGDWAVVFEFGGRTLERTWTIEGEKDAYEGTAETQAGTVEFESVELAGNALTVVMPGRGGRPSQEVTVIIEGDSFEGSIEMGPRSFPIRATRTSKPEGGGR